MRKVTYGAACSLDGFLAAQDGSVDWLHSSADAQRILADYWATIDTILMGRKTWEVAAASGGGGHNGKIRTYVFSRTLRELRRPGVELVSSDPGAFVRKLKQQPGKDICVMGGGEFASALFAAGVIDAVGLNVHPLLLGSGVPLFVDPGRATRLRLRECRPIDGGCVYASYEVLADA